MAARPNVRLSQDVIAADRSALAAVMNLSDYAPTNPAYSIAAVQALETAMLELLRVESRISQEADAVRDQAIAAINAFHKAIKAVKAQVLAQYGDDSVALHAVGLKKVSERKRPTRRLKAA